MKLNYFGKSNEYKVDQLDFEYLRIRKKSPLLGNQCFRPLVYLHKHA
jgi:hypothetical protein